MGTSFISYNVASYEGKTVQALELSRAPFLRAHSCSSHTSTRTALIKFTAKHQLRRRHRIAPDNPAASIKTDTATLGALVYEGSEFYEACSGLKISRSKAQGRP